MLSVVKIKKLVDNAVLPVKATYGSVGYDLVAVEDAVLTTYYGRRLPQGPHYKTVGTGLALDLSSLPHGVEAQIRPRSGLAAKHGITVLNSPGTIDRDYRGELKVILVNHGLAEYEVKKGDRIAQLVFSTYLPNPTFIPLEELDGETDRGEGGFGSTGK